MPPSSIAQVFARLFALKWILGAIVHSVSLILTTGRGELYSTNIWIGLIPTSLYLVGGIALWIFAPACSRLITRGRDESFRLNGVTQEHLFSAVLLGLGVYFFMDSFSNVFGWIHYFAVNRSEGVGGFHLRDEPSYYDLSERLLTMAAGIGLVVTCKTWARRLTARSRSEP